MVVSIARVLFALVDGAVNAKWGDTDLSFIWEFVEHMRAQGYPPNSSRIFTAIAEQLLEQCSLVQAGERSKKKVEVEINQEHMSAQRNALIQTAAQAMRVWPRKFDMVSPSDRELSRICF